MIHASLLLLMVPREGGNATLVFAIQMLAIFGIFYFLLIRPQQQEQKKHVAMVAGLKKGDDVVTSGGIIGTVVFVDEAKITIKSGESRLIVERNRIARVASAKAEVS